MSLACACFWCGDHETDSYDPCSVCEEVMHSGIALVEVLDTEIAGPGKIAKAGWPTGRWIITDDTSVILNVEEPVRSQIIEKRVGYVPSEIFVELGLGQVDA